MDYWIETGGQAKQVSGNAIKKLITSGKTHDVRVMDASGSWISFEERFAKEIAQHQASVRREKEAQEQSIETNQSHPNTDSKPDGRDSSSRMANLVSPQTAAVASAAIKTTADIGASLAKSFNNLSSFDILRNEGQSQRNAPHLNVNEETWRLRARICGDFVYRTFHLVNFIHWGVVSLLMAFLLYSLLSFFLMEYDKVPDYLGFKATYFVNTLIVILFYWSLIGSACYKCIQGFGAFLAGWGSQGNSAASSPDEL